MTAPGPALQGSSRPRRPRGPHPGSAPRTSAAPRSSSCRSASPPLGAREPRCAAALGGRGAAPVAAAAQRGAPLSRKVAEFRLPAMKPLLFRALWTNGSRGKPKNTKSDQISRETSWSPEMQLRGPCGEVDFCR